PGVAHAEPLAHLATHVDLAAGRAVADDVPGDDLLGGLEARGLVRAYDEAPAGQPLADVVVGVALEAQRDARREEGPEGLPGGAEERQVDGAVGKPRAAVTLGHLVAEDRADAAVHVAD